MVSSAGVLSVAGCAGNSDSGVGSETVGEVSCREETVVDEFDTYNAGESITWRFDLEEGEELEIEAVQSGEEARPKVDIKDPRGDSIAEVGPSENIRRTITADSSGTYYVEFVNEALVNDGQWDITIDRRTAAC